MSGPAPINGDDFSRLLDRMPNNTGLRLHEDPDGRVMVFSMGLPEIEALQNNRDLFHVIMMSIRPGCRYFMVYLEMTHFEPMTPANEEMRVCYFKWQDMVYYIISVPYVKKHLCYHVAKEAKMRIANGIPVMMADGEMHKFPLNCEQAYSLENEGDSPLYAGEGGQQDAIAEENYRLQKFYESRGM